MRRIAISGLVTLAAVVGGVAVPAVATASPVGTASPAAVASSAAVARPAAEGLVGLGAPSISCAAMTDCLGVEGSSLSIEGDKGIPTRVARWNGSVWRGIGVTMPKGTKTADLSGVSRKGAKSCLVVGDYYTSTSESAQPRALALAYDGTSLKPTTVPLPKSATGAMLTSVSCPATRHCVAVGTADGDTRAFGAAGQVAIIETWNGAHWALHTVATANGSAPWIEGVSCATSAFCVLMGGTFTSSGGNTISTVKLASWNGRQLRAMKPPALGGPQSLPMPTDLSCATPSNCAVVGYTENVEESTHTLTMTGFFEVWNGKAWRLSKLAWPAGVADSALLSVSCYAARACEAVGQDQTNLKATAHAAAVSDTGTSGTAQLVPAPSKGDQTAFFDVSCLPGGGCVAVGETGKATAKSGAVMTGVWNGKAWKLDPGF